MFAAASGARLAHRHAKPAVQKQASSSNIEGLQVHYKSFQLQHQRKAYDGPNLGPGARHIRELSYLDLNARIPRLDFEGDGLTTRRETHQPPLQSFDRSHGKAAWQDRELGHLVDHGDGDGASDGTSTHRSKQKDAHRRWVKRNRIHDSCAGDGSSDEEDIYGPYGVQNTAANTLLYIGLGTMCVGTIIAFVGTGEKGFRTLELRLIGPSLVAAGILVVILRIALCVCPFHCLKHKRKHKNKLKNSTNKLNSEDAKLLLNDKPKNNVSTIQETPKPTESKDITSTVSFLECERAVEMKPISIPIIVPPRTPSEISVTSLTNGLFTPPDSPEPLPKSKFHAARQPQNAKNCELLLIPTALEDPRDGAT